MNNNNSIFGTTDINSMATCKPLSSGQESAPSSNSNSSSSSRGEADDLELTELGPLLETGRDRIGQTSSSGDDNQAGKVSQEDEEEEEVRVLTLPLQAHHAMEKMEEFVYKVWEGRWRVIPYDVLPDWLKDNDYLLHGHRPPMPSFRACFRSIFRIHTETGNIWTHLLGFVLFLFLGVLTMLRPNMYFMAPLQEKVVFGMFFLGAVLCLSFSWLFHTVYCHSEKVSRTFSKLDYSGIALLIMGSFVPWLYYSFYCSPQPRLIYLSIVCVLGISAIIVAQWDRFSTPKHRPTRAGVFLGLGLSGIVPTLHFTIAEGFVKATTVGQMGWFFLMAVMYITGAGLYAARIPERFFPGKFDIWVCMEIFRIPFSVLSYRASTFNISLKKKKKKFITAVLTSMAGILIVVIQSFGNVGGKICLLGNLTKQVNLPIYDQLQVWVLTMLIYVAWVGDT